MICKKCGAQFSGNFCPNCGEKAESPKKPIITLGAPGNIQTATMAKQRKGCLMVAGAVLLLFIVIFAIFLIANSKPKETDLRTSLIYASWTAVENNLKSPKSAEFPPSSDDSYNVLETNAKNIYYVKGHVDADNSFGVKIRSKYVVKLQYDPEKKQYKVLQINIT